MAAGVLDGKTSGEKRITSPGCAPGKRCTQGARTAVGGAGDKDDARFVAVSQNHRG